MRPSTGLKSCSAIALFAFSVMSSPALLTTAARAATDLPPVKVSHGNAVAQCATPGRLMSFIKARNPNLDAKFEALATEYMRHGEELGLRWDYGFFQMLVETGFLTFTGDVKPEQNNFAGLGTTGGGVKGEKFVDVSSGARAHLEHLAMYSGQKIDKPVAERTKNIQDWDVLTKWQKTIKGPMTFAQVAKQWAPKTRSYASDIKAVADRFMSGPCNDTDPNPELVAQARSGRETASPEKVQTAAAAEPVTETPTAAPMTKGDELAKQANDEARAEGGAKSALGASSLAAAAEAGTPSSSSPDVKILNATPAAELPNTADAVDSAAAPGVSEAKVEPVSLTSVGKATPKPLSAAKTESEAADSDAGKSSAGKCKVFTASYGGESAVIVKATADTVVNYTVLHVNAGAEKREADAYIAAYAKGGETVGSEFKSQDLALDKAFELCPEG